MGIPIDASNAETIGRPIIEKAIALYAENNHAQYVECFPNLGRFQDLDYFNEASKRLKVLGDAPSIEYLDYLVKPSRHLLVWKLRHQSLKKAIILQLIITDNEGVSCLAVDATDAPKDAASSDTEQSHTPPQMQEENAESLGTPIIEKLIQSVSTQNFDLYCQILPKTLKESSDEILEIFNEAATALKPMGIVISIKYLAHTKIDDVHRLIWKVQYQKDDEDLLWQLMLTDGEVEGEMIFMGWSFDR